MSSVAPGPLTRPSFGERTRRAEQLAAAHPPASEALRFYTALVSCQASVVRAHPHAFRHGPAFAESLDFDVTSAALPEFLSAIVPVAPARLQGVLRDMGGADPAGWRAAVERYWRAPDDFPIPGPESRIPSPESFILASLLQPFAEVVASRSDVPGTAGARCPVCGGQPVVALLREEAHGAKRSLVCGFCLTEWRTGRIECLACGETRFETLPVFRAEELPAARLDACDACRTYVKTIDLTKDGTAVPIVDDIATLALDLWARERGYRRLRQGLLRL